MTTIQYSALTQEQLMQVAYLFADDLFGTDATAYLYELDKSGGVIRRSAVSNQSSVDRSVRARIRPPMTVSVQAAYIVTPEQVRTAQINMEALAASIAESLYQKQLEEVTP